MSDKPRDRPQFFDISELPSYRREAWPGVQARLTIEESPAKWAAMSGYSFTSYPDDIPSNILPDSLLQRRSLENATQQAREALTNVCAQDLTCLYWNWGVRPNLPSGEVLFSSISRTNTVLSSRFWAKYLPFLSNMSEQDGTIDLRFVGQINCHHIDEDVFLLGGVNQEGHFTMDLLPNLIGIKSQDLSPDTPIIVGKLYPYQRRIIEAMNLNYSFYQVEPPAPMSLDVLKLKKAYASHPLSSKFKAEFLSDCASSFRNSASRQGILSSSLPRYFYLKRGFGERTNRVENRQEIEDALNARGFLSVSCDNRDPKELISLFSNAQLIVSESGTPFSNFCNYCPPDCKGIWLMPESVCNGLDISALDPVVDVLLRCTGRSFIYPGAVVGDKYAWSTPHVYPVAGLIELVERIRQAQA